ncbi:hypothetical protein JQX08_01490 [Pseudomonas sp. UL073]|uniref:Lipoprotein n=1 Tax=Zestomonas insulae TaxID=2809017 RepID=A0ABS2I9P4_9GAMM|nr:hypothetical protein [Pseudomonas insulae]MBM7059368.1 hypothetical protein [Pseudomonas insulae]
MSRLSLLVVFAWAVTLLSGCQSQLDLPSEVRRLPERVELNGVPFFAEPAYMGVPGGLAVMLSQQGVVTTPGLVAKQLRLPSEESRLEQGIVRVANDNGFLVYPLRHDLGELLVQVAAGYPALVRFNAGLGWVSSPRYGVLVGYDRAQQQLLFRAGASKRWVVGFDAFESGWQEAGGWAVLIQAPRQLPAEVDLLRWQAAADQLDRAGQAQLAKEARETGARVQGR